MAIENFDFAAWRGRMETYTKDAWQPARAAAALHRSRSSYWKSEREGKADGAVVWAAYGLECYYRAGLHLQRPDTGATN